MAAQDSKLRFWLLGAVVTFLTTVGSCAGQNLYARVGKLEDDDKATIRDTAVTNQKLDDFKTDFDGFKSTIDEEIKRHHPDK